MRLANSEKIKVTSNELRLLKKKYNWELEDAIMVDYCASLMYIALEHNEAALATVREYSTAQTREGITIHINF